MASIFNNSNSIGSSRRLQQTENRLARTNNKLASGSRINRASDDAAGLQISDNLRADTRLLNQARRNANDGIGVVRIADGVLEEATGLLTRASEISLQAASGTTSPSGREALNAEYQEILGQLDSLGINTRFDEKQVFGGEFDVRVGEEDSQRLDLEIGDLSTADLGIQGTDLLNEGNASSALDGITSAIESLSSQRGSLGAKSARLEATVQSILTNSENIQAAESAIRDADIAGEVVNQTALQILQQTGVKSVINSNLQAQTVLSLIEG